MAPFWKLLASIWKLMIFYIFNITFISGDYALICHRFWDGCFGIVFDVFVDTFSVRARSLLNLQTTLCLQWVGMILHFKKTWCLRMSGMLFVTSFGIELCWYRFCDIKLHMCSHSFLGWMFESKKPLMCSLLIDVFFDGFGNHCWWWFDTCFVRARNLLNLQKPLFVQWISMLFHIQPSWLSILVMFFFGTCFGIHF